MSKKLINKHMSKKELAVVQFVAKHLAAMYCDSGGKPVYRRNCNEVMEDVFGVKKFCKTFEKGLHNEQIMISLMQSLDLRTIWTICRTPDHYKMLCSLVAIDREICRIKSQQNKILNMDPGKRPANKYNKLGKRRKKLEKQYSQCVKAMRKLFGIKRVGGVGQVGSLLDYASNWKDRYAYGGDGFFFDDFGSSVFSGLDDDFDDFFNSGKKSGAFGLFDDDTDQFSIFDEDEPEPEVDDTDRLERLVKTILDAVNMNQNQNRVQYQPRNGGPGMPFYDEEPSVPYSMDGEGNVGGLRGDIHSVMVGQARANQLLADLVDALTGDDESDAVTGTTQQYSVEEIVDIADSAHEAAQDSTTVVVEEEIIQSNPEQ